MHCPEYKPSIQVFPASQPCLSARAISLRLDSENRRRDLKSACPAVQQNAQTPTTSQEAGLVGITANTNPMLVPVVSYFISYPAFKCLQYHPMPQTCVWTVIGDQNPTYEPYGYGAQKVQKRAKNTSNLHRSSHSYAHTIIFYVVLIIQMHTIPTQAPNMCVDGDR